MKIVKVFRGNGEKKGSNVLERERVDRVKKEKERKKMMKK